MTDTQDLLARLTDGTLYGDGSGQCLQVMAEAADALEAAQAEITALTAELGDLPEAQADMLHTIKELRARLTEVERQEPVGYRYRAFSVFKRDKEGKQYQINEYTSIATPSHMDAHSSMCGAIAEPLYAAAGASPVQPSQAGELSEAIANLIDATEGLMAWQVKNVQVWHNGAYDTAAMRVKQLRAAINAKESK